MWAKGETLNAKDYGMSSISLTSVKSLEMGNADFELLKMAMYMDHNDQSVWLYHRWLIGDGKHCFFFRVCWVAIFICNRKGRCIITA